MHTSQRRFSGERDKRAMIALAQACPTDNRHVADLPYRLSSWALDDPDNVALWVDDKGQLLAWAVMQTPFWTIDYACHPDADTDLHRQILAWANQRARRILDTPSGHPCWFVMVFAAQTDRIQDLEAAVFTSQADVGENSWSKVLMQRPAQMPVADCTLPAGFVIRPLAGESEVEAYVQLHQAVFESKSMTAEWRRRTLHQPAYLPDLDLVAVAPDERLAAFCICWLDAEKNRAARSNPWGYAQTCANWAWDGLSLQQRCGGCTATARIGYTSRRTTTGTPPWSFTRRWGSA